MSANKAYVPTRLVVCNICVTVYRIIKDPRFTWGPQREIVLVAPFWRGRHDKSVGSIRGFFVWNSKPRNATMPQLARMWIIFRQNRGKGGKRRAGMKPV